MSEVIRQLQKKVGALERIFQKVRTRQLNVVRIRDNIRTFVQYYFKEFRPAYILNSGLETELDIADSYVQELLRCAQKRTLINVYRRTIKEINSALYELEIKSITPIAGEKKSSALDDIRYKKILETLIKVDTSAATAFEQGLRDLQDPERKSWRGAAVEFRESLRELLDTMAPDEEVKSQPSFKLEPNAKGPTMKQKAVFILKSRQTSSKQVKAFSDAIDVAEELVGKFVRSVYDRLSVATHTQTDRDEVLKIRNYVSLALIELLEINV